MVQSLIPEVITPEEADINAKILLETYKGIIPAEFDSKLLELLDNVQTQCHQKMNKSGMRPEFARNAMQGNHSRCMLEDQVVSLAEDCGLKAGPFRSGGGSYHAKISTQDLVVTVHTLGDQEGNTSRYTEYKSALSRSNPIFSRNLSALDFESDSFTQGSFIKDAGIGQPELILEGDPFDQRLYYTICVPRFLHRRSDVFLIVPGRQYTSSIIEFNYRKIRDESIKEMSIQLYTENEIKPKKVVLKSDDENLVKPTRVEKGKKETNRDQEIS